MILTKLKQTTQPQHELLERDLNLLNRCPTLADYRQLMARFYGFYEPLEAQLSALLDWRAVPFDFEQRRKTLLLVRDLQALGLSEAERAALPRCHELPTLLGFGSALGCLYVLEGATLGGQIIARHFNAAFQLTPENGAAFYHGYGAQTGPRWKEFGAFATESATTDEIETAALEAAQQTFTKLHRWLI